MNNRYLSLVLLLAVVPAVADTVYLKEGGRLEGNLLSRENGTVRLRLRWGVVALEASEVLRIVAGKTPAQRFEQRLASLPFTDLVGHYRLAQWCKVQGLQREMQTALGRVVELEPDHRGARSLLGQRKVGTRWLPQRQAMRALGFVWYSGRWHRPEALTRTQRERAYRHRASQLKGRVEPLLARLASSRDGLRLSARRALIALARVEGLPQLAEVAGRLYREYSGYWMSRRNVVTELRLGFTQVRKPMRTLALNLGGTSNLPVTIQLPQVTSISASTTTILPGGSSR